MKFINRNNRKLKKHLKKLSGSIRHVLAVPSGTCPADYNIRMHSSHHHSIFPDEASTPRGYAKKDSDTSGRLSAGRSAEDYRCLQDGFWQNRTNRFRRLHKRGCFRRNAIRISPGSTQSTGGSGAHLFAGTSPQGPGERKSSGSSGSTLMRLYSLSGLSKRDRAGSAERRPMDE